MEKLFHLSQTWLLKLKVARTGRARFKMREIEKSINFNNVRFHTVENHADELAVKVLKYLDIPFDDYFLSLIDIYPDQKNCTKIPNEEPYSAINEPHHTPCWRYWRAGQLDI